MSEPEPQGRIFLRRLVLLVGICLLAQCTPTWRADYAPPPPQVLENAQVPTPTPEEELELFNTFLERA